MGCCGADERPTGAEKIEVFGLNHDRWLALSHVRRDGTVHAHDRLMKYRLRAHVLQVLGVTLGFSTGCGGQVASDDTDGWKHLGPEGPSTGVGIGGEDPSPTEEPQQDFGPRVARGLTDDVCSGGVDPGWIQNLNPADPVDALVLRQFPEQVFDDYYQQEAGQPLEDEVAARADDLVVEEVSGNCSAVLGCPNEPLPMRSSHIVTQWGGELYEPNHLVAYRGDEATIYYTPEELRAFLGTIDTPEEAKLVLALNRHHVICDGEPNFTKDGTDYLFFTTTGQPCGEDVIGHVMRVSAEGKLTQEEEWIVEVGDKDCQIGRLPQGLCAIEPAAGPTEHAEYMARVAYLEAASVAAFEDMRAELLSYGAPSWLCDWAAQAAREERRHALHCRALTRKFGGSAPVPNVRVTKARSPLEMARDNAREGLTREAFGALVAAHQALMAEDADVRHIMSSIAEDEMGHAEFSLALHQYLMSTLSAEEQKQVETARIEAIAAFRDQVLTEESATLRKDLGLPDRDTAQALFTRLFERAEIFQC